MSSPHLVLPIARPPVGVTRLNELQSRSPPDSNMHPEVIIVGLRNMGTANLTIATDELLRGDTCFLDIATLVRGHCESLGIPKLRAVSIADILT
jgi:hypothetical protein